MATHSSILAWWIPWTERSLVGHSPRGCKSRAWLSDFTFTKLKTAVCCWTPVFSRHWARHFYLLSLILLTNPSNPWYFSLNSDVFFTFIVVILFLYVYLMFIVYYYPYLFKNFKNWLDFTLWSSFRFMEKLSRKYWQFPSIPFHPTSVSLVANILYGTLVTNNDSTR